MRASNPSTFLETFLDLEPQNTQYNTPETNTPKSRLPTAIMADQLAGGIDNMSLGNGPAQLGGQPPRRSYIPPHMRGKGEVASAPAGPPPPMNSGLNQSAWAG